MQPVSRREALVLGGLGAAGLIGGAAGVLASEGGTRAQASASSGAPLAQPAGLVSADGVLSVALTASESTVDVGGRRSTVWTYNGRLPGPTWRVRPGDRVRVSVRNTLDEPTNLHVHGLHVSPEGNSDNPFVRIQPGSTFDYEYRLPADHPPGVYWYHPHHHGTAANQVFAGLYGAIIVEDPAAIPVARERVLVVSDISFDAAGRVAVPSAMERMRGREGNTVLVNGQVAPRLTARPGERERWRIVNAATARYLRLRLDGQRLQLLGIDSGRSAQPRDVDEVVLAPGNRADLLVTMRPGTARLQTLPVNRGGMSGMMGGSQPNQDAVTLATLAVGGAGVAALPALPAQPAPRDLRGVPVAAHRRLTFAMGMGGGTSGMGGATSGIGGGMSGMGGMSFTVDRRPFDPARVDTRVRIGTVEEWTLTNTSLMDHPIHLHVWPMQVLEPGREPVWRDVVNVPARSSIRVRIPFEDFPGRTVYHCHILDHEDAGMMAVVDAA